MYGKAFLVRLLRDLDRRLGPEVMAVVDIMFDDHFDFASLGPYSNGGVPGLPVGQLGDWRVPADDGPEGLHGHVHGQGVAFHLDREDPCRDPIKHGAADTKLVPGAVIGGVTLATIVALAGGKSKDVAAAGVIGFGVGGTIGGHIPARRSSVVRYRDLFLPSPSQPLLRM